MYVPSAPVHESLFESATVVATNVADVAWTELGPPPWANAMPARARTESAAAMAASGLRCIVGSLVGFAYGIGLPSGFQRPHSRELRPGRSSRPGRVEPYSGQGLRRVGDRLAGRVVGDEVVERLR